MVHIKSAKRYLSLAVAAAGVWACSGLLDVSDPSRFTDEDVDKALDAVARGAEGLLHAQLDNLNTWDGLLSDVYKHTGTWAQWDDADHGRIRYSQDGGFDNNGLLVARYAAQDAFRRFDRLESEGETVPVELRAQVLVSEGWADLLLGQHFCESAADPTVNADGTLTPGPAITDTEAWTQGVAKLRAALPVAAGTDFALWAEAGIARGELMLGNLAAANTAATNVLNSAPPGWQKAAQYQQATLENAIVNLATFGFNHAGGMREKWWPLVDNATQRLNDPWSLNHLALSEPDPRVPIRHQAGVLGVDGTTDYHSQFKYSDVGSDIPITHLDEMRLIQAEVAFRNGDFTTARNILNGLRAAAGLSPAPDAMADEAAEVQELLLNERFAELFFEGQRQNDLVRFGLIPALMAAGDFFETAAQRIIKLPLDQGEAIDNPNIEDNAAARCSPTASSS